MKNKLKIKQLNTINPYRKSCTRPLRALSENAIYLLSAKPKGKLIIKLNIEDATCGLIVFPNIISKFPFSKK